jgi:hypothetical protein
MLHILYNNYQAKDNSLLHYETDGQLKSWLICDLQLGKTTNGKGFTFWIRNTFPVHVPYKFKEIIS